jgi:glycosyltransferase involved in cell wall biosynthesis
VHVLFVSWRDLANPNAGGSEVVVDHLANGLRARGHEASLLCAGPVGERPYEVIENGSTYSQYVRAPWEYLRRFRGVDLVVDVANGIPFFSPLWRRGPRLCFVHHVHAEQWDQYFPRPIAAAANFVEQRGVPLVYRRTHFVAVSPSTARDLVATGVDERRVHVVCNGVSVPPPAEPVGRSTEPLFVALGRIAPNKRLDQLLDIWARVAPQIPGRLVIAGDGPDRERIAARVASEPALGRVTVEGRVSEARKAELLSQAWLFAHTSEREGWGIVLLEAGLFDTPTLAYRVPGVMDAVVDGVTGVLVDDDDEFVREWVALAGDPARRQRLGAAAARRAAEFSWDRSVDEFLKAADAARRDHRSSARLVRHGH